jgi:GTP pyrophosphokinase
MARCCRPAPGDEICGYITRGRGITVHRKDCPNILRVREPERLVETMWGEDENTYAVSVRISAFDRDGLMRDVSAIIADENVGISHAVIYTKKSEAVFELVLNVRDVAQLSRIFNKIEQLPNVKGTQRVKG